MGPSLTLFVALFLGFASMTQSDEDIKCEEKITPKSECLNPGTLKDYYERNNEPSTWICTAVKESIFEVMAANNRLKYFRQQAIDADNEMRCDTWPILISAKKSSEEHEMCWLVPSKVNAASLKPSNEVEVKEISEVTMFVRCFDGIPSIKSGKENAEALKDALTKAKESFDDDYYGAGYFDKLHGTWHNEIWIPKKNK